MTLALAGLLLAACSSATPSGVVESTAAPPTSAPVASSTTTTTTTTFPTTTTLPTPTKVPGTSAGGTLSSFGSVERVPVVGLLDGSSTLPPVAAGASFPPADATQLAFREFGSGPDLVLIAGEHATMNWWDPQLLQALAQQYTVTIFDLPGTGFSAGSSSSTSLAGVADMTAGLVDELGLHAPVVFGWGLGGEIALAIAERHPGLVSRLVLVDSSTGGPNATRPSTAVADELASATATPLQLASLIFPPALTASITGWMARVAELPPDDLVASAIADEAALQANAWADTTLASDIGTLHLPALVVVGSSDVVFPPADSAQLAAALHTRHRLVLPGAGYAAIFQDTPQFVAALEQFTS